MRARVQQGVGQLRVALCAMGLAALLLGGEARGEGANLDKAISPGEWALLPEYCIDTQAGPYGGPEGGEGLNRSPRARKWVAKMGRDFWAMHHYCYALRDLLRVKQAAASPHDRAFLYERAAGDLRYVIENTAPSMPLMPEVLLRMGEVQLGLGNSAAAGEAFARARQLKPDYWPAYVEWIDVLVQLGLKDKALALARDGVSRAPDSAELQRRLDQLEQRSDRRPRSAATEAPEAAAR